MKLTYAVVIEQTPNNYGAYAPDVPGCISTAETPDEMLAMIREALTFHIEALIEDGDPVPEPTMSIDDAIAYHSQALSDAGEDLLAKYGDAPPTLSTRFELVEIEVPALQGRGLAISTQALRDIREPGARNVVALGTEGHLRSIGVATVSAWVAHAFAWAVGV